MTLNKEIYHKWYTLMSCMTSRVEIARNVLVESYPDAINCHYWEFVVLRGVGGGGLPPSKRVRCVSEISFAMGGAQFTFSSNDYFTASCILATGETLVGMIKIYEFFYEDFLRKS